MKKGFYTIMSAQFFSSLADNALLVAAIELLKTSGAPSWNIPALTPMFALFYVILAPFVGAFADAIPKGTVMFISNAIKVVGCLMMLFGGHPLIAYAIVGLGAAAYSPAKYGILTELLPRRSWSRRTAGSKGLTILSIIFGVLLGGQLVGHVISRQLLSFDLPILDTGIATAPRRDRGDRLPVRGRGPLQSAHSAHRMHRCSRSPTACACWCATSRTATPASGTTSSARSRWRRRPCSGASRATCA
jgi:MFS family permease